MALHLLIAFGYWVAASALFVGGARKLRDRRDFALRIDHYEPRFSRTDVLAVVWGTSEVAAAVILVLPVSGRAIPAVAVLSLATGALFKRLVQGARHDCGCSKKKKPITPLKAMRNALLVALGLAATTATSDGSVVVWAGIAALTAFLFGFVGVGSRAKDGGASLVLAETVDSF